MINLWLESNKVEKTQKLYQEIECKTDRGGVDAGYQSDYWIGLQMNKRVRKSEENRGG